jgi:branched-chain amino acid transport system permease protein
MLLSLLIEVSVYRPLKSRKSSLNVAMIASIGVMTIVVNLIAMFFGNETKVITNEILKVFTAGNIILTTPQLLQAVVGIFAIAAFLIFISKSNWGIRLRAVSCDETLYSTIGYNVNNTRVFVFLLSGAFIALAGCLTVYDVGLDPHMGMNVLINAMVAMIIGGVGRFGTCVAGGLILGLLQSLVVFQFASNWQNAITFLVLLIFLFFRPQGIAGYKQRTV